RTCRGCRCELSSLPRWPTRASSATASATRPASCAGVRIARPSRARTSNSTHRRRSNWPRSSAEPDARTPTNASDVARPGMTASMSDYVIPPPEPKEIDEKLSMELRILASNAVLKGHPSGEEKCDNCLYYLEPTAEISYCWH